MTDYLNGSSSSAVNYSLYGVHDGSTTLVADLVGAKLDYENLKQILDEVKIESLEFSVSADIKMLLLIIGKPSGKPTCGCPFCNMARYISVVYWTKLGAIVVLADKLIFGTPCTACTTDQFEHVRRIMH